MLQSVRVKTLMILWIKTLMFLQKELEKAVEEAIKKHSSGPRAQGSPQSNLPECDLDEFLLV